MSRLLNRRVAVIGAGSVGPGWGNGKAAAVTFAREGARVLCVDRHAEAAEETAAIIRGEGGAAEILAGDMTDETQAQAVAAAMRRHWGGTDVLHFNIGISDRTGVADTTIEGWQRVFDTNLTAALRVSRAVLPDMRAQQSGCLIFVSSLAAIWSGPFTYASYEVSKAALCRLSASIAKEFAPEGIRSNSILPGPIDTPHVQAYVAPGSDPAETARARAAMVPMGRQGTAWDIANAALFLASDEAGFITGVDLKVDGGLSL